MSHQEDIEFIRVAVQLRLIEPGNLPVYLKLQEEWAKTGRMASIPEILMEQKHLSAFDIKKIRDALNSLKGKEKQGDADKEKANTNVYATEIETPEQEKANPTTPTTEIETPEKTNPNVYATEIETPEQEKANPSTPTTEIETPEKAELEKKRAFSERNFGRYRLLAEIGRGGMGKVYKAYDPDFGRTVALKILLSGGNEVDIKRFLREAKATAKLHHPNIVTVYDMGTEEGERFFTMDFIEGCSLQQWIQKTPHLTIRNIVEIMQKIGDAVQYAHEQGIIHRDIKPANVMIDQMNEPKVMDFGLAKVAGDSSKLSQTGTILGTIQYMPPEQAEGTIREVDEKSDVYALGAVLYEMLTGHPPFLGNTFAQILKQILYDNPVPPISIKPQIPIELQNICMKALEKNKKNRYQSCREFVDDLRRFSEKKKVKARHKNRVGGIGDFRHYRGSRLISFLGLILIVSIWFYQPWKSKEPVSQTGQNPGNSSDISKRPDDRQADNSSKIEYQSQEKKLSISKLSTDVDLEDILNIASDGSYLYLSGISKDGITEIWRCSLEGKGAVKLYTKWWNDKTGARSAPMTILGDDLLWVDANSGTETDTQIFRASKNPAGTMKAIYTGSKLGEPIVDAGGITTDGRDIWVVDMVGGAILQIDINGSLTPFLQHRYSGNFASARPNSLLAHNGFIYVLDSGDYPRIQAELLRIPSKGGALTTLFKGSPFEKPTWFTIGNGSIFISDWKASKIWRMPIEGGTPSQFISTKPFLECPKGILFCNDSLYLVGADKKENPGKGAPIYRIQ